MNKHTNIKENNLAKLRHTARRVQRISQEQRAQSQGHTQGRASRDHMGAGQARHQTHATRPLVQMIGEISPQTRYFSLKKPKCSLVHLLRFRHHM